MVVNQKIFNKAPKPVIYLNALTFALNSFETQSKTFEDEVLTPFMPMLLKNGAKRTRTADPLHAMQVLYQLSYGPESFISLS